MKPIISESLLSHYLPDFRLSSVANIREIGLKLKALVEELKSGKIENAKEEEIKPRFINTFFGDILGFNYGNSNWWQLKDEKKSTIDGTKPDAALGYFYANGKKDDVRAVVEIKDAKTDLDKKQNRPTQQTAIEQAFSYVAKMGGKCTWVIVSNIKEIRFYPSLDRSRCQVFFLEDLVEENNLKKLLFLFHKDRFITYDVLSATDRLFEHSKTLQPEADKSLHVIDKMYNSLKKFEGFGFIDPNYIATILPFNVLNDHVWHYYNHNLFTLNREIYELLTEVDVVNQEVIFSVKLQNEILNINVVEAKFKIEYVFKFLNNCLINEISAVKNFQFNIAKNKNTIGFTHRHPFYFKENIDGITKNIRIADEILCDCVSCNYRSFDFNKLLSKLKAGIGNEDFYTREYAYGNYLTASNNFKTTYNIYKEIEKETKGKQGKAIEYFIAKYNIKLLHNLLLDYEFSDGVEIMKDIKSVDLDKVLYDEIEYAVDKDVKKYLIDFKEDTLIFRLQDKIDEILSDIEKLKLLYDSGGKQTMGPNLSLKLQAQYFLLYLHVNRNYLVYDVFKRYKSLSAKVFKGLIISCQTPEYGTLQINTFFLTEAIVHIPPKELQEILKKVDHMKVDENAPKELLVKLNNFTTSYFKEGLFGDPYKNSLLTEQLNFYRFKDNYTNIFSNLFTIISRIDLSKEQFQQSKNSLLNFLKIEDELAWFDLQELQYFIIVKGDLFEAEELKRLLKIAIDRDRYGYTKYTELIKQVCKSLKKFYPDIKFNNLNIVKAAVLKSCSEDGELENYAHLIDLANISDDKCKSILFNTFNDYLDKRFNQDLYAELILNTDFNFDVNDYFKIYSEQISLSKGARIDKFGTNEQTDFIFINYILVIYKLNIDFKREEFQLFTGLNNFEKWLLNPIDFDYNDFDARWLIDIHDTIIIYRLKNNKNIKAALDVELTRKFNPILGQLRYQHFT